MYKLFAKTKDSNRSMNKSISEDRDFFQKKHNNSSKIDNVRAYLQDICLLHVNLFP